MVVKEEINDLYGDDDYYANPEAVTEMVDNDYEDGSTEARDINSKYGH